MNTISEGPAALSAFFSLNAFSSISEVIMQAHSHWANVDLDQILDKKNSQAQSAFCSFLGRKIEFFITNFSPYFPCTLLLSYDFIDSIFPPICLLAALSATFFQAQMMLMQVNWLDFNPDCFSIIHWKILTLLCNLKFKSLGIIEFPYSLSLWGITGGLTGFVSNTQSLTSNSC